MLTSEERAWVVKHLREHQDWLERESAQIAYHRTLSPGKLADRIIEEWEKPDE